MLTGRTTHRPTSRSSSVGHIVVPGMLLLEQNVHPPSWVHMVTWVPVTLLLTLALLPPIKGAVIGAQWALRMKS